MIRAKRVHGVDLCEPHYYGYAVEFGYLPGSNIGALQPLSNELVVREWLLTNAVSLIEVGITRVVFDKETDAQLCYLAFA